MGRQISGMVLQSWIARRNSSRTEDVNFLQIWVFPKERNIKPRYDQKLFPAEERKNTFHAVVGPEKNDSSLWINQDAWFSLGSLAKGFNGEYGVKKTSNGVYVFVIEGELNVNGQQLSKRDGFGVWETDKLSITAESDAEVLLIDVPMN